PPPAPGSPVPPAPGPPPPTPGPPPVPWLAAHTPFTQLPLAQALPQAPQLFGSEASTTHALLQFSRPAPQVAEQVFCEQTRPAPHALPHAPQFWGSDVTETQTPLQST